MGIFIEDLLHFGNLIDKEIEVRLTSEELRRAYPDLDFRIEEGILKILLKKRFLFFNRSYEIRLSEVYGKVRKDRESLKQWAFFKVISKDGIHEVLKLPGFTMEDEYLGMDVMPAVSLTEVYERIPKQFKEKLLINRYKIGKDHMSVFFKFEK